MNAVYRDTYEPLGPDDSMNSGMSSWKYVKYSEQMTSVGWYIFIYMDYIRLTFIDVISKRHEMV